MLVKDWIEFAKCWNRGETVEHMAKKFNLSKSVVRSRVQALRKKGVSLVPRHRVGVVSLTEKEVADINRSLK